MLVCLYFFGGPSMEDFAWTISAGILIGTYSSIFIASPAALFFSRKHGLHEEVRQARKAARGNNDMLPPPAPAQEEGDDE